jgi:nucleoid DNA-binding protein
MEELLNQVVKKTGLPADQARSAVTAVLGFIRGKLPAAAAGQFDSALSSVGQQEPLPTNLKTEDQVAEQTGLAKGQVGSLIETVLNFLKAKLPAGVGDQLQGLVKGGGAGGLFQKVAGMFGGKSS